MPYTAVSAPDHVPQAKRKQWAAVWNSAYAQHGDEKRAFMVANGVAGKTRRRSAKVGPGFEPKANVTAARRMAATIVGVVTNLANYALRDAGPSHTASRYHSDWDMLDTDLRRYGKKLSGRAVSNIKKAIRFMRRIELQLEKHERRGGILQGAFYTSIMHKNQLARNLLIQAANQLDTRKSASSAKVGPGFQPAKLQRAHHERYLKYIELARDLSKWIQGALRGGRTPKGPAIQRQAQKVLGWAQYIATVDAPLPPQHRRLLRLLKKLTYPSGRAGRPLEDMDTVISLLYAAGGWSNAQSKRKAMRSIKARYTKYILLNEGVKLRRMSGSQRKRALAELGRGKLVKLHVDPAGNFYARVAGRDLRKGRVLLTIYSPAMQVMKIYPFQSLEYLDYNWLRNVEFGWT